jgi:ABC-2 type transport system ATP-binding protein
LPYLYRKYSEATRWSDELCLCRGEERKLSLLLPNYLLKSGSYLYKVPICVILTLAVVFYFLRVLSKEYAKSGVRITSAVIVDGKVAVSGRVSGVEEAEKDSLWWEDVKMSKEVVIQTLDLTKFYGEILAVDHVNFQVERGEIFGFLGPNGAGKTTTIKILTGLSQPTEGRGSVLGFDIKSEMARVKKHIGVVPEVSNLYDELSAIDNLLFMGQLYGLSRTLRRKRAEELLKNFRLYERKDTPFRTFSRGMKRSLTIAAGLIHNPEVLFLDESTVGLDVVAARSLRNLIGNLRQQGMTIFLTTHYLEEADLLCDRVAVMVKGRIIKIDSPKGLKTSTEEESVIEISFETRTSNFVEELSNRLPGVKIVSVTNNKVRIYGGSPTDVYGKMFRYAKDKGVEIQSVNSIKPSLEDAFIKITGLSPMVMAMEKGGR